MIRFLLAGILLSWVTPAIAAPSNPVGITPEYLLTYEHLSRRMMLRNPVHGKFSLVQVEVGTGLSSKTRTETCLGWVIGGGKEALMPNGLTYPVVNVLRSATLSEVLSYEDARTPDEFMIPPMLGVRTALMPALLHRVGAREIAESLARQMRWSHGMSASVQLVDSMTATVHLRYADALVRKEDKQASKLAKQLSYCVSYLENDRFDLVRRYSAGRITVSEANEFCFDALRRVDTPYTPPDPAVVAMIDRDERIRICIRALSEVQTDFIWMSDQDPVQEDPYCKMLVKEGPAALPALLDAYENDHRMTRTVSAGRPWWLERRVLTVKELAWRIIRRIVPRQNPRLSSAT